jgi:hypothetical protein
MNDQIKTDGTTVSSPAGYDPRVTLAETLTCHNY